MRYQVGDTLGHGAISTIYRGLDTVLRRPIVVKAIPSEHIPTFRQALQLTSDLTHPAIVATFDAVELDQWLFLVQESVSARSLDVYLPDGIPAGRTVDLSAQLARALAYAHSHNVIHGDLTPTAVLVDRRATVRVNNFALPPDTGYFSRVAATLPVEVGDPVEVVASDSYHIPQGQEGDVWAVGLLLWQLLSVPESHPSVAPGEGMPAKRGFREDVSPEVRELVLQCVQLDHPRRIKDAEELTVALEMEARALAGGRRTLAEETPPALRVARTAVAHIASWSTEDTLGTIRRVTTSESVADPPGTANPSPNRPQTRPPGTDKLLTQPRLRLPTRPGADPLDFRQAGARQRAQQERQEKQEKFGPEVPFVIDTDQTAPRVPVDVAKYTIQSKAQGTGPTTLVVVVLAMALFLLAFVAGYILAALPLGGH
jgi:serine/threonine protein kinase